MDSLLDDNKESERTSRSRQRAVRPDASAVAEERESSVCRDVDKDPMMIESMKKEREAK